MNRIYDCKGECKWYSSDSVSTTLCLQVRIRLLSKPICVEASCVSGRFYTAGDYDGRTTLHLAVAEGQIEVTTALLNKGAKPDVLDRWGTSPLCEAISAGSLSVAEILISRGAKLERNNFKLVKDACEVDPARLLLLCLKANVNPDSADYDQRSVLHAECLDGNLQAVEALLSVGANVNASDRYDV